VCCTVMQCVAACCGVLQCVAVRGSVRVANGHLTYVLEAYCSALHCAASCCSMLQYVAVCVLKIST